MEDRYALPDSSQDAAEADITRRVVDHFGHVRQAFRQATIRRAGGLRTSFQHLAQDAYQRLSWVIALLHCTASARDRLDFPLR